MIDSIADMRYSHNRIRPLIEHYHEISLLSSARGLLDWDLNVNLPPKASEARAAQSSLLTSLIADRWQDPSFMARIEKASDSKSLSTYEKAIVRNLNWSAHYYRSVPKEIIVEFSKTTSEAFMAWQQAKKDDNFKQFAPHLKKIVKLNQIIAGHLGYKKNPYDALLNQYEQGLTAAQCKTMFSLLKKEITKLLKQIQKSNHYKEQPDYVGADYYFPRDRQTQLSEFVIKKMGYDMQAGHLAASAHPFTLNTHRTDVRITTWYDDHDIRPSLMASIHEAGHALYEQGIAEEFDSTPITGGVSLGIHESQSRFWENQIGRSHEFLSFMTPVLHAFFPDTFADARSEDVMRLFNHVSPSLIRVESDEVTYNLHIALRFEIEEGLINDRISVKDLPELWRSRMKELVGIAPETDREGVLQDVHWSYGSFGYFPTYTLGNLYASQFTETMKKELDIATLTGHGEFGTILSWLRENIHTHGSMYWPDELVKRVTGNPLDPSHFISYLTQKYRAIYN